MFPRSLAFFYGIGVGMSSDDVLKWRSPRARAREIASFNIGNNRMGLAVNTGK